MKTESKLKQKRNLIFLVMVLMAIIFISPVQAQTKRDHRTKKAKVKVSNNSVSKNKIDNEPGLPGTATRRSLYKPNIKKIERDLDEIDKIESDKVTIKANKKRVELKKLNRVHKLSDSTQNVRSSPASTSSKTTKMVLKPRRLSTNVSDDVQLLHQETKKKKEIKEVKMDKIKLKSKKKSTK